MKLVPILKNGTVGASYPEDSEVVASVLEATVAMYGRSGFEPPWIGYLAAENGIVVGTCGFTGPPKSGEVELAYFTFPGHEGVGVATRMGQSLVALARRSNWSTLEVCAHTLPEEGASAAILRKLGFVLLGEVELPEDGIVWKWTLEK
jgi:RimJ/RimL family protein N-acetyltransferase